MKKLSREEIKEYVHKIRIGEGDDAEVSIWILRISESIPNPEVTTTLLSAKNDETDDEVVDRLYSYKPIIL